MSDPTANIDCTITKQYKKNEDSVYVKSLRLSVNLLTNMLMFLVVFVCLLYACGSEIGVFNLHIIFCVLGYHFFMCQGTIMISKYNSWSMYIPRRHRRVIHSVLQCVAAGLVTVGSGLMIYEKTEHFNTTHGTLGICALITTLFSLLNGLLSAQGYKRISYPKLYWTKFIHHTTGVLTTCLATASLCVAFGMASFTLWTGHNDVIIILVFLTWLLTVLVTIEYWILVANKIRCLI